MMVKAVFRRDGTVIGEFPIHVEDARDLKSGGAAAFDELRKRFPNESLFDIGVSFEKLTEDPNELSPSPPANQ
jgi:hypothetical protein